jgi:uncharacterized protein (TIGR02118 family)
MYKVTVVYNLPPGADHDEFIKWRTGSHQNWNLQMPGLLRYDFYKIEDSFGKPPPYRYMSELYFADREAFVKAFYDPNYQSGLAVSLQRVADPLFLMSEEVNTVEPSDR